MQIFPVLDLLQGVVVRAIKGMRGNYRPVVSRLVNETSALAVARAFRLELGLDRLYLADLDAILYGRPNFDAYKALRDDGFELMVDAGVRTLDDARAVLVAGATAAVVGLETIPGPELIAELAGELGPRHFIFSLDLRGGVPMGALAPWETEDPFEIAVHSIELGVRRMIVLDLAAVGAESGVTSRELCLRIRASSSELELITGGGVRHPGDLRSLAQAGIDGALVASALHDGQVTQHDLESLRGGGLRS